MRLFALGMKEKRVFVLPPRVTDNSKAHPSHSQLPQIGYNEYKVGTLVEALDAEAYILRPRITFFKSEIYKGNRRMVNGVPILTIYVANSQHRWARTSLLGRQ